jgi:hypothetical protein
MHAAIGLLILPINSCTFPTHFYAAADGKGWGTAAVFIGRI